MKAAPANSSNEPSPAADQRRLSGGNHALGGGEGLDEDDRLLMAKRHPQSHALVRDEEM